VKAPAEVSHRAIVMVFRLRQQPTDPDREARSPVMSFPDVVRVPLMERFPPTSVALLPVTVPESSDCGTRWTSPWSGCLDRTGQGDSACAFCERRSGAGRCPSCR